MTYLGDRDFVRNQSGLTLVELVVVAVLLALMSAVLFGTINGIIRSRNTVEQKRIIGRTARYVLGQIREDLRARVAEPVIGEDEKASGAGNPYQNTYMIGRRNETDQKNADTLTFVTQNLSAPGTNGTLLPGHSEVSYYLTSASGTLPASGTENADQSLRLIRDTVPAGTKNKKIRDERRSSFVIADNISGLRFRYLFSGKWSEQWLPGQARLPDAIEVTLDIGSAAQDSQRYKMLVALNYDPKPTIKQETGK